MVFPGLGHRLNLLPGCPSNYQAKIYLHGPSMVSVSASQDGVCFYLFIPFNFVHQSLPMSCIQKHLNNNNNKKPISNKNISKYDF